MSKDFFLQNLNYSMANEDTHLEREIARLHGAKTILSVCGSGSRVFPLVNSSTHEIDCLDMSGVQLDLARLRLKTILDYDYEDFLKFWGYEEFPRDFRKDKFQRLVSGISKKLLNLFNQESWQEPIYYGEWEKTYRKLNRIVRFALGNKRINKLKECKTIVEQIRVFQGSDFQWRWRAVLVIVGNRALFNSLLYKGKFVQKNIPISYVQFYIKAFEQLITKKLLRDSYFLQMSFLGKIEYSKGAPLEAQESVFYSMKESLGKVQINFIQENIVHFIEKTDKKYDFISISDVPSYFSSELGKTFLQGIEPSLNKGGVIVVRYYLNVHSPDISGFQDITSRYAKLISEEGVQMYKVKIYQKN